MRAFRVAYDGRPYHGFQRQPDVPTVEDRLFAACRALGVCEAEPQNYAAAGRTDRGVSALAQTVGFDCPDWLTPAALNSHLPDAIRAWASVDPPDGFHPTHDARRRSYEYHLFAPGADLDRARAALSRLAGQHDFHNLTPDASGTVRDLTTDCDADGDFLVVSVSAGGFARELVRRIVSLVGAVAAGDAGLDRVERVLGPESVDGPAGVAAAPPHPLVLTDVTYDVSFDVDERAAADARRIFGERYAAAATSARVTRTIRDGLPR